MVLEQYIENEYLRALAILVIVFVVIKVPLFFIKKILLKITSKTKTTVDDKIINRTNSAVTWIVLIIGLKVAINQISFLSGYPWIDKIFSTLIILFIFYAAFKAFNIVIDNWGKKITKRVKANIDDNVLNLVHKTINVVGFILSFLYTLSFWGVEITPLLASLGIGGIAIAFALQSTLGNIFGGVSLLLDKSVKVGDRIQLESGESGIVTEVGLRSTKIRAWSNDIIVIPNGQLSNSKIQNFLYSDRKARVTINFGVAYGSDVDKVESIVLKAVKSIKDGIDDPAPGVDFLEMGDSALLFMAKFWVDDVGKRYGAKLEANKKIYNALNKEKIVIPFPQMDVHLHK
ncbi:MAG: mechanosensitive ion channel domain-containing protein [Candidatus Woesearchaeota archaeon]